MLLFWTSYLVVEKCISFYLEALSPPGSGSYSLRSLKLCIRKFSDQVMMMIMMMMMMMMMMIMMMMMMMQVLLLQTSDPGLDPVLPQSSLLLSAKILLGENEIIAAFSHREQLL